MSDKENKTLPVALLVTGIVCIMILSCCFVWLVVRCERWRRRRKYRPKCGNRYAMNASHMANGQELKELQPRHLKPSVNLIHYHSKNSVNSQSIPSLLSMDDSVASEPLYSGRNYEEEGEDVQDYRPAHHDLSIARILGSFPELPYYQPPSVSSGSGATTALTQNVRDTKVPSASTNLSRSSRATASRSQDCNLNSPIYSTTEYDDGGSSITANVNTNTTTDLQRSSNMGSANTLSSAESLKVEIPGCKVSARYMTDNFQFTRLKGKGRGKAVSTPNVASISEEKEKVDKSVLETEV